MNRFVAPAGELRVCDLPPRFLDLALVEAVVVSGESGTIHTTVHLTELWQARTWVKVLACPGCAGPARVLRVRDGRLLCGRCLPPESAASRVPRAQRSLRRIETKMLGATRRGDVPHANKLGFRISTGAVERLLELQESTVAALHATSSRASPLVSETNAAANEGTQG